MLLFVIKEKGSLSVVCIERVLRETQGRSPLARGDLESVCNSFLLEIQETQFYHFTLTSHLIVVIVKLVLTRSTRL